MKSTVRTPASAQQGLTLIDVMLAVAVLSIIGMPSASVALLIMLALALLIFGVVAAVLAIRILVEGLRQLRESHNHGKRPPTVPTAGRAESLGS